MKKINVNYCNKSLKIPILSSLNDFKKLIQNNFQIIDEEMEKIKLIGFIGRENIDFELNEKSYDDFIKNDNSVKEIKIVNSDYEMKIKNKEILDLVNPILNNLILKCNYLEKEIENIKKEFEEYKKDKGEKIEIIYKYLFKDRELNQNKTNYVKSSSFNLFRNSIVNDINNNNQPNEQNINQNINEQEIKDNNTLNNFLNQKEDNNNNINISNIDFKQSTLSIFNKEFVENINKEVKPNEEKKENEFDKKQSLLNDFYNAYLKDKKDEVKPNEEKKENEFDNKQSLLSEFYNEFLKEN